MWLFYFLIIYIIFFGLLLGLGKSTTLKKKTYLLISFGLLSILAALRGKNIGNDTEAYLRLYERISISNDLASFSPRYEMGYVYLNKLLSFISIEQQFIIIFTSIILMLGFARFIYKYSQIPWLSVYLFFTLGYFGMSMNTIRTQLAIILVLFSYDFLRKRKLTKFILIVFLATLFHKTALVFLLAWPISKLKINYKMITGTMVTSVVIYIFFPFILNILFNIFPTYQYYIGSDYLNGEIRLASQMNFLVGLSIVIFGLITNYFDRKKINSNEIIQNNQKFSVFEKEKNLDDEYMLLLLIIGISITFISFNFNLLDRIGDYFLVFSIVYLPNAIKKMKKQKSRVLVTFIILVLFFTYATLIQLMRPEWNMIYPYNFFG